MNDLIEKLSNLRSQFNCFDENERDAYNTLSEAIKVLSAQTEPCDDPRADVYYLAEKIGIHQLYALVVKLRGEPETCEDAVSRNAIIQKLNTMDRYVSEELILCDTDKKFPKNEVFIVDDVYEEIVENLPSAQPETDCVLKEFGNCSYSETGCSDCKVKAKIRSALSTQAEPCNDDKGCSNCMYSGRPTYKSPCSECRDKSQWEMKPISRSHENGTECEDAVSREQVLKLFSTHDGKYLYEAIQMLPSVTLKLDHSGDATEMVEYDDCVSRQAVIDTARKVSSIFEGEYDTRTPYGVAFDIQMAVDKLPSVTPKLEPCEDAVSRKELLKLFSSNKGPWTYDVVTRGRIKALPSVTPKRKTGKWIRHLEWQADGECGYECDQCGMGSDVDYNFCMKCGAKMDGRE